MNDELLFRLLSIASPTGHEERMKAFLEEHLEGMGVAVRDLGPAGLSWELGDGQDIAFFTAHIDEVALVIERIDDEGYIHFQMPGVHHRIVPSQEVTVWGKRALRGVVGMVPPHLLPAQERKTLIPGSKLFVDVGLPADEVRELVSVGTVCTWVHKPSRLQGSRVSAAGLDNRIGLFLALLVSAELKSDPPPGRVRFFASTQEERTMLGAGFAGRTAVKAGESVSFAVVADATYGASPGARDKGFALGRGPALGVGPILSRPHLAKMRAVASELSIPYVLEPLARFTGTEADVLSLAGEGIPSILVSIPVRYMHSPVEVADLDDVESARRLLCAALRSGELWSC